MVLSPSSSSLSLSLVLSVVECVFFFALFLLFHSPSLCLTFFFLSAPFSSRLVVFLSPFLRVAGFGTSCVCVCVSFFSFLPSSLSFPPSVLFLLHFRFALLSLFITPLGSLVRFPSVLFSFTFLSFSTLCNCLLFALCLYCFLFSSFVCFSFFYVTVCVSVCSNV